GVTGPSAFACSPGTNVADRRPPSHSRGGFIELGDASRVGTVNGCADRSSGGLAHVNQPWRYLLRRVAPGADRGQHAGCLPPAPVGMEIELEGQLLSTNRLAVEPVRVGRRSQPSH